MNDGVLFMDKKGAIIDVNETVIELSGYKKEDLLGKNIRSLAYMLSMKSMTIIIRKFLKRMADFRVSPYEVEMIKKNSEEAINMVRRQKPAVVIMDMLMPKMDGLTACYTMKNDVKTRSIPVIILTAIDQELNRKLSTTMGVNKYMTKPFSAQELLETIKQLLASNQ